MVGYDTELRSHDLTKLFRYETLIKTELTTLYGLMIRGPIDLAVPPQSVVSGYCSDSQRLLEELHRSMLSDPGAGEVDPEAPLLSLYRSPSAIREMIFYAAESAYTFQYRDLAARRYALDQDWLFANRGFDLNAAAAICRCITDLIPTRLMGQLKAIKDQKTNQWTLLPGFSFEIREVTEQTGIPEARVEDVLRNFAAPSVGANSQFTSLGAFNEGFKYPLLRIDEGTYALFQAYGLAEALYDAPFYWMTADKAYEKTVLNNRGAFAESFAFDRLLHVLGASRVFQNVELQRGKGETLGEVDVLAVFGDRAIVLQAKSKKMTLAARNGNDLQLKGDFKLAVQDAVDQAMLCSVMLEDRGVTLRTREGSIITLQAPLKTIFPISLVTDHYPSLAWQARANLKFTADDKVMAPLVIDVFALDAMTEMLDTPLRFVSYLWLRARWSDVFMTSHESTLLSYHLTSNLWVDAGVNLMMLSDDISAPLDVALAARRDGVRAARTPHGILTKFAGTRFDKLIKEIENSHNPAAIAVGLALLEVGEESIKSINKYVGRIIRTAAKDNEPHDFSLGFSSSSSGITFHVNSLSTEDAEDMLYRHCARRKYLQKASAWHGVTLTKEGDLHIAASLSSSWRYDAALEAELSLVQGRPALEIRRKIGRNEFCPCRSMKKYKHCCGAA